MARLMLLLAALLTAVWTAAAGPARAQPAAFDALTGYRVDRYRAPVPVPPDGVPRLGTADVRRAGQALLIDVAPAEGARRDPATGRWTLAVPHLSLPGALWFPEVGRGTPEPVLATMFERAMARLAPPPRPIIVFCHADCWMSWNAALRLHRRGHNVAWYGEGDDGWREAGLPLAPVEPYVTEEK